MSVAATTAEAQSETGQKEQCVPRVSKTLACELSGIERQIDFLKKWQEIIALRHKADELELSLVERMPDSYQAAVLRNRIELGGIEYASILQEIDDLTDEWMRLMCEPS